MFACLCFTVLICSVLSFPQSNDYEDEKATTSNPKFISKPVTVTLKRGSTVNFPCKVDELGSLGLLWWHEQDLLYASGIRLTKDERFNFDDNDITITDVKDSDGGSYRCTIGTQDLMTLEHHLLVEKPPQVRAKAKEVIEATGSPATLACVVEEGVPAPKITWRKDDQDLKWTGAEVTIEKVNRRNAGKYTCVASNGVGESSSDTVQLSVMYPPEVQVQQEWIHSGEGYQAEIVCLIQGEPKPQVEWFQGTTKLDVANSRGQYKMTNEGSEYVLTIDGMTVDDFGFYVCRAQNQQGSDHKQIEVSGIAKNVTFTSDPNGDAPDSYRIMWQVDSYSPVEEYMFRYRKAQLNATDKTPGEWKQMAVKPDAQSSDNPEKHTKSLKLSGLDAATQYDAVVLVRNKFGWNKGSDMFKFATQGAKVPLPITGGSSAPTSSVILSFLAPILIFLVVRS